MQGEETGTRLGKCKSLLISTETYSFLYIFNCATYVGKMLLDKNKACPQTRLFEQEVGKA